MESASDINRLKIVFVKEKRTSNWAITLLLFISGIQIHFNNLWKLLPRFLIFKKDIRELLVSKHLLQMYIRHLLKCQRVLLVYKFSDYKHTEELERLQFVHNTLKDYFKGKDDLCSFVANCRIYGSGLCGFLIKPDTIISVELRNYERKVTAEN